MNLPNKLTLFRIMLIPVFIVLSAELPAHIANICAMLGLGGAAEAYGAFVSGAGRVAAGVVFVVAFVTDALDGFIARKYNLVTDFGKFLDPIADKLLVSAALVVLAVQGDIGVWVPVVIISREFIVTGLRLLAVNRGIVLAAGGFGKAKTAFQFAALTLILFQNFNIAPLEYINAGLILLYAATVLTVMSGVDYITKNRALLSA